MQEGEARLPMEEQAMLEAAPVHRSNIPELASKIRVEIGSEDETQK
jgi:hypothetical protein